MAAVLDDDAAVAADRRPAVAAPLGDQRQRGEDVEARQRRGGARQRRVLGRQRRDQLGEQLRLERAEPLLGAQHLGFVLLELRRDEALAAGDRLLAPVVAAAPGAGSAW